MAQVVSNINDREEAARARALRVSRFASSRALPATPAVTPLSESGVEEDDAAKMASENLPRREGVARAPAFGVRGAPDRFAEDERSAAAELGREQFAARQVAGLQAGLAAGLGVLGAGAAAEQAEAFAKRPGPSKEEEQLWDTIFKSIDGWINSTFLATFWTVVVAILIAPIVAFYYLIRLFYVNHLNGGKPRRFPLFGIVSMWIMPLKFPLGLLNALLWVALAAFALLLAALLVVVGIVWLEHYCSLGPLCEMVTSFF